MGTPDLGCGGELPFKKNHLNKAVKLIIYSAFSSLPADALEIKVFQPYSDGFYRVRGGCNPPVDEVHIPLWGIDLAVYVRSSVRH